MDESAIIFAYFVCDLWSNRRSWVEAYSLMQEIPSSGCRCLVSFSQHQSTPKLNVDHFNNVYLLLLLVEETQRMFAKVLHRKSA